MFKHLNVTMSLCHHVIVLDYETCRQLASKYNSVSDLLENDKSLYGTLLKKGWMKDFFPE